MQLAALRSAGWRVFAPSEVVAFHMWSRAHRPLFWHAREGDSAAPGEAAGSAAGSGLVPAAVSLAAVREGSLAKVRALLEGPQGLALGKELGVDFVARTISVEALTGGVPEDTLL